MITQTELERRFNYHKPDTGRAAAHELVRRLIKSVAVELCNVVPDGREQAVMLTNLEDAMFWANAGIAREGK